MSTDPIRAFFGGLALPEGVSVKLLAAAAQSITDSAHDTANKVDVDFSTVDTDIWTVMAELYSKQYELKDKHQQDLLVNTQGLSRKELIAFLFVLVIFAHRYETDCMDGFPRLVFLVTTENCQSLDVLFSMITTTGIVSLRDIRSFLTLFLRQGTADPIRKLVPDDICL